MSNRDLLVTMLEYAINEQKKTNFADKVYGIPVAYCYNKNILTIQFNPTYIPPDSNYVMNQINSFVIDMEKYSNIASSNSAFTNKTQMFYFSTIEGDYFVITFGC